MTKEQDNLNSDEQSFDTDTSSQDKVTFKPFSYPRANIHVDDSDPAHREILGLLHAARLVTLSTSVQGLYEPDAWIDFGTEQRRYEGINDLKRLSQERENQILLSETLSEDSQLYQILYSAVLFPSNNQISINRFLYEISSLLSTALYHRHNKVDPEELALMPGRSHYSEYDFSLLAADQISQGNWVSAADYYKQAASSFGDSSEQSIKQLSYLWISENIEKFLTAINQMPDRSIMVILDLLRAKLEIRKTSDLFNSYRQLNKDDYTKAETDETKKIESEYQEKIEQLEKQMEDKVSIIKKPRLQSKEELVRNLGILIGIQGKAPHHVIGFSEEEAIKITEYVLEKQVNPPTFMYFIDKVRQIIHHDISIVTPYGSIYREKGEKPTLFVERDLEHYPELIQIQQAFGQGITVLVEGFRNNYPNESTQLQDQAVKIFMEVSSQIENLQTKSEWLSPASQTAVAELLNFLATQEGIQIMENVFNRKRHFRPHEEIEW